jgi:predicted XRE-type DNA-binding protein
MMKKKTVTTKNVFADLGFGTEEAANLHVRARLMAEIEKYIRTQRLTQKAAATRLGVTQLGSATSCGGKSICSARTRSSRCSPTQA